MRVLAWLTEEAMSNGKLDIRASCREIEEGTGMARTSSIRGTKQLVTLRLIAKREGTATSPAAYLLNFARTLRMGGSFKQPPVERNPQDQSAQSYQGGPKKLPPKCENAPLFEMAPGVLSIDSSALSDLEKASSLFDRSSENIHSDAERAECSALMRAFVIHRLRHSGAHPPDKKIVGMMLCVCEWEHLRHWLEWMTTGAGGRIKARQPEPPTNLGSPYAWLLKVAINHMHGIPAAEQKPTLELLRGGRQMFTRWHTEGAK